MATAITSSDHEGIVEELVNRGAPSDLVDREIEALGLDQDQTEALKLYAWAWRETAPQPRWGLRRLVAILG